MTDAILTVVRAGCNTRQRVLTALMRYPREQVETEIARMIYRGDITMKGRRYHVG